MGSVLGCRAVLKGMIRARSGLSISALLGGEGRFGGGANMVGW